jgi:hypothetical protein
VDVVGEVNDGFDQSAELLTTVGVIHFWYRGFGEPSSRKALPASQ